MRDILQLNKHKLVDNMWKGHKSRVKSRVKSKDQVEQNKRAVRFSNNSNVFDFKSMHICAWLILWVDSFVLLKGLKDHKRCQHGFANKNHTHKIVVVICSFCCCDYDESVTMHKNCKKALLWHRDFEGKGDYLVFCMLCSVMFLCCVCLHVRVWLWACRVL